MVYPDSPTASRFDPGFSPNQPTGDVSDNITSGAYASAPDQGLGFYFSGMVSANRTKLELNSDDLGANHPTVTSPTFIKVDMTTPNKATWTSLKWPSNMIPRSEGGLIWLPYGKKGVLVAIGGVEVPGDLFLVESPRITATGPFMTELAIYDIDADTWFTQETLETTEKPSQLAAFCTAVISTQDGKSFEIFVYGGYDGTYTSANPNVRDDVWVLSVPAFQWTKVVAADSSSTHGRQSNVCFAPNPTTMITVGGTDVLGGALKSDTIIDVLNLNTLTWDGKYNSSSSDVFVAPAAVVKQLNWVDGKGPGNVGTRGLNDTLNTLFSTPYTGTVASYYPYSTYNPDGSVSPTNGTSTTSKKDSEPAWKIPVIAVLCTLGGLAIIGAIIFCLVRKRRNTTKQHNKKHSGIFAWLSKSSSQTTSDGQTEKWTDAGESTAIGSDMDYHNNAKARRNTDIYEITGDHGAPDASTPGSTLPSAISRANPQELMGDSSAGRMSTSTRPAYGGATSGAPSESGVGSYQGRQFVQRSNSVHELPQGKSEEDLPISYLAANGTNASHRPATNTSTGSEMQLPSAVSENAPTSGTPFSPGLTAVSISERSSSPIPPERQAGADSLRPYHHRNQSSLSDNLPDLPSPPADVDKRQSRMVEDLPDYGGSPVSEPTLMPLKEHPSHT